MILIVAGIIGFITLFYFYTFWMKKNVKKNEHIEQLKNALLAFALNKIQTTDPNFNPYKLNMDYASFDGTELPMFSGCDITNACFSYITPNGMYTHMQEKQKAIERYFTKNLNTTEQVQEFFKKYINSLEKSDPTPDANTTEEYQKFFDSLEKCGLMKDPTQAQEKSDPTPDICQ